MQNPKMQKMKFSQLPKMAEDELNSLQNSIKNLKGGEVASGLLGAYANSKLGDNFDVNMDRIEYSPNDSSSYSVGYSPGNITVGAKWRF